MTIRELRLPLVLPVVAMLSLGACATAPAGGEGSAPDTTADVYNDGIYGKGLTKRQAEWLSSVRARPAGR